MAQAQYTNITTVGTTLCAVGPGSLEAIVVNKAVINGVITIYDSIGALTNKIGTITFGAALKEDPPISTPYGVRFANGCLVVSSTAVDMTVVTQGAALAGPPVRENMVGWFDFSDPGTLFTDTGRTAGVVADGDLIKGVADKSVSGAHLSEATNAPTYRVNTIGGRATGRFLTASSTTLTSTTAALTGAASGNDTPVTVYCVLTNTSNSNKTYWSWGDSLGFGSILRLRADDAQAQGVEKHDDSSTAITVTASGTTPSNVPLLQTIVHYGTSTSGWRNGVKLIDNAAQDVPAATFNRFSLGALIISGTPLSFANCDMGELIAFKGAHSEAARIGTERYLAKKWGITLP